MAIPNTLAACTSPYSPPSCLGPANSSENGLNTFGFVLAEGGTYNLPKVTQFQEVAKNSNAAAWAYNPANPSDTAAVMEGVSNLTKAYLTINDIFTRTDGTIYSDSEITSRLQTLSTVIAGKTIYVYLGWDEPVWRAQTLACGSSNSCLYNGPNPSIMSTVTANLEKWADMVRQQFPGIGIFLVEAHPIVRSAWTIPKNFDLYSFDCYGPYDACSPQWNSSTNSFGTPIPVSQIFATLKSKVSALNNAYGGYRRLAVVPEATIYYNRLNLKPPYIPGWDLVQNILNPGNAGTDSSLLELMNKYITLAKSDSMVTTILGFLWGNINEGPTTFFGIRGYPNTRTTMEIEARAVSLKPAPWPYGLPPVIEFQTTQNMKTNDGGSIWSWTAYDTASCKSITEPQNWQDLPASGGIYRPPETSPTSVSYTISCTNSWGTSQKSLTYTVSQ